MVPTETADRVATAKNTPAQSCVGVLVPFPGIENELAKTEINKKTKPNSATSRNLVLAKKATIKSKVIGLIAHQGSASTDANRSGLGCRRLESTEQ